MDDLHVPEFFFAIGASPRIRDFDVARAVGQDAFLVSAGTRAERMLRTMQGVRVLLDSGAWPIDNPNRISLDEFWWIVRWWSKDDRLFCAMSYDTIGSPSKSERDHETLMFKPWRTEYPPIVRVVHYPNATAQDIIGEAQRNIDELEQGDIQRFIEARQQGYIVGNPFMPAVAIGGLVPARGSNQSREWYQNLLHELSRDQAQLLDITERRIHLLGISRAEWVSHPLVMSFDSSTPARLAAMGGWDAIASTYKVAFGLSREKLERSREARLAYHIIKIRHSVGLPWNHVDERDLLDDDQLPAYKQHRTAKAPPAAARLL